MSKFFTLTLCMAALVVGVATAQSNELMDQLLDQSTARLDTAGTFILAASGRIAPEAGPAEAMEELLRLGLVPKGADPGRPVTVEELSFMLMKAFDLPGGLMYMVFPGPRYAYRTLKQENVVADTGGPWRRISGEEVIRSILYAIEMKEGSK